MSTAKMKPSYYINSLISVSIMVFFRFLPAPDPITPYGMALFGIFLGAIWGWCTVSMIWPTLVALTLLGLTGDNTVNGVWSQAWGNVNILFIFFMMIFAELLKDSGLDKFIASWALSLKFTEGRPYILIFVLMCCAAVAGMVTGATAAILLFWAIIGSLTKELGYDPKDKLSAALALGVVWCGPIGMLMMPFQTTAVLNYSLFFAGTGGAITSYNYISYLAFGVVMGVVGIIVYMLFLRFVIRPDISKFANFKVSADADKLKMDGKQKMATYIFIALVVLLLVPSFFTGSTNPVLAFINKLGTTGSAAIMLAILAFVVYDGKPFVSMSRLIQRGVIWDLIFMLCAGLTIGGQLSSPATGITAFVGNLFAPILSSVGGIGYLLIFMFITLVLTNCMNNVPVAAFLLPLQYGICMDVGMNPLVVIACFIFIVDFAVFLPSSSPVGAMLHSSGLVEKADIYKWCGPLLVIFTLVIVFIGYPFGLLVF